MPINLWKGAGKPVSYSPLVNEAFASVLNAHTDYRLSFKSKSNSNGVLLVTDTSINGRDIYQFVNLNSDSQLFVFDFLSKHSQNLHFIDSNAKGDIIIEDIQLIEKPLGLPKRVQTPKRVIAPAKKGLVMDGVRNYIELQVAPPTNYAIEFEFILNTLRRETHLVSFRNNQLYVIANGSMYVRNAQISTALTNIKPNVWYKMRVESQNGSTKTYINNVLALTSPFDWGGISPLVVGDFWSHIGDYKFDGTFKYVKLEDLNTGQTVAHYDFTNPNYIIGDKILQSAKNLIPSFDSQQWSLHPNFKVLGKDVGRLDASASLQLNSCKFSVIPNQRYTVLCDMLQNVSGRLYIRRDSSSGTNVASMGGTSTGFTFTTPSDVTELYLVLTSITSGSFDFIRPQLYELDGKEGSLYGNPQSELKAPKRVLYAKR
jgi:hypothetical protein